MRELATGPILHSVPPITATSAVFTEPERLAGAIRGADLEPCLLSRGTDRCELFRAELPGTTLDTASLGSRFLFSGSMPKDCVTLLYVHRCPTPGHALNFGVTHGPNHMAVFRPGGEVRGITPAGFTNATLTIPLARFIARLEELSPDLLADVLRSGMTLQPSLATADHLMAAVDHVRALADFSPAAAAAAAAEERLIDAYLSALDSSRDASLRPAALRPRRRTARLRAAIDRLNADNSGNVTLTDLCEAAGVSRRGLEQIFRELAGTTPSTVIQRHRLHGVRRTLMAASPAPGAVKQAAYHWGFWHLGRFAVDYRRLFGESPSVTLRHAASARR